MEQVRGKPTGCERACGKVDVPTEDEVAALKALRSIKERVRELKKIKSGLSERCGETVEPRSLEREMAELKMKWEEWEEKRKRAARERMILLGHEDPD